VNRAAEGISMNYDQRLSPASRESSDAIAA
jgi:hypothetical protein